MLYVFLDSLTHVIEDVCMKVYRLLIDQKPDEVLVIPRDLINTPFSLNQAANQDSEQKYILNFHYIYRGK